MRNRGFTMVELIVVVAITAIIALAMSRNLGKSLLSVGIADDLNQIEDIKTMFYAGFDCAMTQAPYVANYCGSSKPSAVPVNMRNNNNEIVIGGDVNGTVLRGVRLRAKCYRTGYAGSSETFYNQYFIEAKLGTAWKEIDDLPLTCMKRSFQVGTRDRSFNNDHHYWVNYTFSARKKLFGQFPQFDRLTSSNVHSQIIADDPATLNMVGRLIGCSGSIGGRRHNNSSCHDNQSIYWNTATGRWVHNSTCTASSQQKETSCTRNN